MVLNFIQVRYGSGDDFVMIEIDGSRGEGGGQILRSALTLSLLTGKPFRLYDIRARRDKPGLRPQHLKAVKAAAEVGDARITGVEPGALTLQFEPGQVRPGDYDFDIGTAGATSLVLQTVYLPLALADAPSRVTIRGGTHVPLSPCFHYLDWHWRRFLETMGPSLSLTLGRAGFYPPGGGIVHAHIRPTNGIEPLHLMVRGRLRQICGLSAVANLPDSIAQRQRDQALNRLSGQVAPCTIELDRLPAPSPGTVLVLLAEFEHSQACFFALGARGKRAEQVADEAVDELLEFLDTDGAVDTYLADQLLLPLAVAKGATELRTARVTHHLLTNAEVIRDFLPVTLEIRGELNASGTIRLMPQKIPFN